MTATSEEGQGRSLKIVFALAITLLFFLAVAYLILQHESDQSEDGVVRMKPHDQLEATLERGTLSSTQDKQEKKKSSIYDSAKVETMKDRSRHTTIARIDMETRRRLLSAILNRLTSQGATTGDATTRSENTSEKLGSLDKEYIREQIQELKPLLKECYQLAMDQRPDLGGKMVVEFSIVGDPELGGLVERSEIVDGDLAGDETLAECIRETMYALQLRAPKGGGRVVVKYPFRFKSK